MKRMRNPRTMATASLRSPCTDSRQRACGLRAGRFSRCKWSRFSFQKVPYNYLLIFLIGLWRNTKIYPVCLRYIHCSIADTRLAINDSQKPITQLAENLASAFRCLHSVSRAKKNPETQVFLRFRGLAEKEGFEPSNGF